MTVMNFKIVSGGQTGVDRAGLEAAIALGLPYGGWVPKGRIAEDGTVPLKYAGMQEHNVKQLCSENEGKCQGL